MSLEYSGKKLDRVLFEKSGHTSSTTTQNDMKTGMHWIP